MQQTLTQGAVMDRLKAGAMPDDDQLIRTAARLTRELGAARPGVY